MKVLMVAEKPSICDAIARECSGGRMRSAKKFGGIPVHTFESKFLNTKCDMIVTSVKGHVFSLDFPDEYQDWDSVNPLDLFDAPVVKKIESKGVFFGLQELARGCDHLVLWLDCDREGENICFEVIDIVQPRMNSLRGGPQQIWRAKFSAVTKQDIERAMKSLEEPNENESLAVDCRQELDLKVGVAFSRFQTKYFHGKYSDLDSRCISYGPCQTPTLGFCVDRHDEIQKFSPEPFWSLACSCQQAASPCKDHISIKLKWSRDRVFDQGVAQLFLTSLSQEPYVSSVKKKESRRGRPTPLNTVSMLKIASKALGIGPRDCMHIAEKLYLSGFISYPRTETTRYPKSFDCRGAVAAQTSDSRWGEFASELLKSGLKRPKAGVDAGDHPPITPCRAAGGIALSGQSGRLFEFITRHFLATLAGDCIVETISVVVACADESFTASGLTVIEPGYTAVQPHAAPLEKTLPHWLLQVNNPVRFVDLRLETGETKPPNYLAEHELISIMEKHRIGTDASCATHIFNIQKRGYCTLESGRTLRPTPLGITLAHGFHKIDAELVLPRVRAAIEHMCDLVAEGKADLEDVLKHALDVFERKFQFYCEQIAIMDGLFEASGKFSKSSEGKLESLLSRCGKCFSFMKLISMPTKQLFCKTCEETLPLPRRGKFTVFEGRSCPLDNFGLLLYSTTTVARRKKKKNGKKLFPPSIPLCPYCYSHPPFPDMETMSCANCVNASCEFSLIQKGVCPCPDSVGNRKSCEGTIVLDASSSANKDWKLTCNECTFIIRFHNIRSLKIDHKKVCKTCGAKILTVKFNKKDVAKIDGLEEKLQSDSKKGNAFLYSGCLICDDLLNAQTEAFRGKARSKTHSALVKDDPRAGGRKGRR
eukprot:g6461.t1